LGPRAGRRWPKFPKHALIVTSPLEKPPPKTKSVFFISSRRRAESVDGLDSSLVQSPGELWPKECEPIYGLARSLIKGCDRRANLSRRVIVPELPITFLRTLVPFGVAQCLWQFTPRSVRYCCFASSFVSFRS